MDGDNDPLNAHKSDEYVDRFRKIREELEAMQLPDLPEDDELHKKMPILSESHIRPQFPEAPQVTIMRKNPVYQKIDGRGSDKSMGRGIAAGYSVFAAVIAFGGIGWLINHSMGVLIGAVFGAIVGLALCVRLLNQP